MPVMVSGQAMIYDARPNPIRRWVLPRLPMLYHNHNVLDKKAVQGVAQAAMETGFGPLVIDYEPDEEDIHFHPDHAVEVSIDRCIQASQWVYEATHGKLRHSFYRLGIVKPRYMQVSRNAELKAKWQKANARWTRQRPPREDGRVDTALPHADEEELWDERGAVDWMDFLTPSLYRPKAIDLETWQGFTQATSDEARKMNKLALGFLWPRFHPGFDLIPAAEWEAMLAFALQRFHAVAVWDTPRGGGLEAQDGLRGEITMSMAVRFSGFQ